MTKTLSIRNFKLELNITRDKDSSENLKKHKIGREIEVGMLYDTIEKEKQETLTKIHWITHLIN
ncbi:hypothetical protein [Alkaliphilus hydrothermalis]|uniref:Uncharacterized protein n=1 Tax=Alkaliphilus hydrothermalis TaxID=1482730 RepID=A0ABS2NPD8_9FIRM|nr:hypothetical protein [Alkaliphilus hydrothermalis]MBM7614813.1 hypothetical protein [Alkaliphilus hydrothermalis]